MFWKLVDWLNLADFDAARAVASVKIASRYSRGNTTIQDDRSMNAEGLEYLSTQADFAMSRLNRKFGRFPTSNHP